MKNYILFVLLCVCSFLVGYSYGLNVTLKESVLLRQVDSDRYTREIDSLESSVQYWSSLYWDTEMDLEFAREENIGLQSTIESMRKASFKKLTITGYTPSKEECGQKNGKTAIGKTPVVGRTAAISRDMMGWLGHKVYIEDLGVFVIEDLMHPSQKQAMDVLCGSKSLAFRLGRVTRKVTLVE